MACEVWDELLCRLQQGDNQQRAIAAQVLRNLAVSDPEKCTLRDFQAILQVTRDKRFVTARHCLRSLWKLGLAEEEQLSCLWRGLEQRFAECGAKKNGTLIRHDIQVGLRKLYDPGNVEAVREKAIS